MSEGMLTTSHCVTGRWQIEELIGRGGFGEVYRCKDVQRNRTVALKLVPKNPPNPGIRQLHTEAKVLKAVQGKKFFAGYYLFRRELDFDYLVMELLGKNLKALKKAHPGKKLPIENTLKMGRMMLKSVEYLHEAGYLHRDIKPSNFAIGVLGKAENVYLIDFGLAKRYVNDGGAILPQRSTASFKGTSRYASANVLNSKHPGRRDDLVSLFYTLLDLSGPKLPWKNDVDRKALAAQKDSFDHSSLVVGLGYPSTFLQFYDHLRELDILDKPNYSHLSTILNTCVRETTASSSDVGIDSIPELDNLSDHSLSQTMSTITGDTFEEELEETSTEIKSQ